ncbi:STAS/SEC14 domain-containing protein [Haloferula sp. A504]|uniref:STAS/SEC14 domain-containing protein n=1 Tax=Haloferula sp. A504 TaxID=3373601 RepID=UPI0031CA631F|nr:STAS/SEC14 domain-containing protein [Verrucomicrobiaceae bacterium E54]
MTLESKALRLTETRGGRILSVGIQGQLDKGDYETFVPEVERLIRTHGKIRLVVELENFNGWDTGGLWEDIKFDIKHFTDIERIAIVGDEAWERGMALFCKPFTKAEVKFFGPDQREEAHHWVAADLSN